MFKPIIRQLLLGSAMAAFASAAPAQNRSDDNAVTQAEDAFGFSVGRETLGIYNAGNARGFSPSAAGNLRLDGLYFYPVFDLASSLVDSTSIKVGVSAQGYPFAAPSGIVAYALRHPSAEGGASAVASFDSFGSLTVQVDGSVPVSDKLTVGYGLEGIHTEFPDGTDNIGYSHTLMARWRPAEGVELLPFWSVTEDYNDEAGSFYQPAGPYLPVLPKQDRFEPPEWSDIRYTGTNAGLLGSAALAKDWVLRVGAFRSVNDLKHNFTNILADELPDGSGRRILIADPPTTNRSLSGEVRVTHSISDGDRLHLLHFSARGRDVHREFGGEVEVDMGPGRIGEKVNFPKPDFDFGEISVAKLRQTGVGVAYDGRWKGVGEVSFGLSRANFDKTTRIPGLAPIESHSNPWLYNGTAAAQPLKALTIYAGYSRGLEESGTAPPNAANRNEPLPVILTEQKDGGIKLDLGRGMTAIAGLFDLSRPYFGYDAANIYQRVGTTRSRGAEFSISGPLTPRLDIVAGGSLLKPRVTRDESTQGTIGRKPVGLAAHNLIFNANWKTPWHEGLDLDVALRHIGKVPATTDNAVMLPPRELVSLGGHYRFKLGQRNAVLRLQVSNLLNKIGYGIPGSGFYGAQSRRFALGYLTVDF